MTTHIERAALSPPINSEAPTNTLTMWCGAQVVIFPDGETAPEGFDFYGEDGADRATCEACRLGFFKKHKSTTARMRAG